MLKKVDVLKKGSLFTLSVLLLNANQEAKAWKLGKFKGKPFDGKLKLYLGLGTGNSIFQFIGTPTFDIYYKLNNKVSLFGGWEASAIGEIPVYKETNKISIDSEKVFGARNVFNDDDFNESYSKILDYNNAVKENNENLEQNQSDEREYKNSILSYEQWRDEIIKEYNDWEERNELYNGNKIADFTKNKYKIFSANGEPYDEKNDFKRTSITMKDVIKYFDEDFNVSIPYSFLEFSLKEGAKVFNEVDGKNFKLSHDVKNSSADNNEMLKEVETMFDVAGYKRMTETEFKKEIDKSNELNQDRRRQIRLNAIHDDSSKLPDGFSHILKDLLLKSSQKDFSETFQNFTNNKGLNMMDIFDRDINDIEAMQMLADIMQLVQENDQTKETIKGKANPFYRTILKVLNDNKDSNKTDAEILADYYNELLYNTRNYHDIYKNDDGTYYIYKDDEKAIKENYLKNYNYFNHDVNKYKNDKEEDNYDKTYEDYIREKNLGLFLFEGKENLLKQKNENIDKMTETNLKNDLDSYIDNGFFNADKLSKVDDETIKQRFLELIKPTDENANKASAEKVREWYDSVLLDNSNFSDDKLKQVLEKTIRMKIKDDTEFNKFFITNDLNNLLRTKYGKDDISGNYYNIIYSPLFNNELNTDEKRRQDLLTQMEQFTANNANIDALRSSKRVNAINSKLYNDILKIDEIKNKTEKTIATGKTNIFTGEEIKFTDLEKKYADYLTNVENISTDKYKMYYLLTTYNNTQEYHEKFIDELFKSDKITEEHLNRDMINKLAGFTVRNDDTLLSSLPSSDHDVSKLLDKIINDNSKSKEDLFSIMENYFNSTLKLPFNLSQKSYSQSSDQGRNTVVRNVYYDSILNKQIFNINKDITNEEDKINLNTTRIYLFNNSTFGQVDYYKDKIRKIADKYGFVDLNNDGINDSADGDIDGMAHNFILNQEDNIYNMSNLTHIKNAHDTAKSFGFKDDNGDFIDDNNNKKLVEFLEDSSTVNKNYLRNLGFSNYKNLDEDYAVLDDTTKISAKDYLDHAVGSYYLDFSDLDRDGKDDATGKNFTDYLVDKAKGYGFKDENNDGKDDITDKSYLDFVIDNEKKYGYEGEITDEGFNNYLVEQAKKVGFKDENNDGKDDNMSYLDAQSYLVRYNMLKNLGYVDSNGDGKDDNTDIGFEEYFSYKLLSNKHGFIDRNNDGKDDHTGFNAKQFLDLSLASGYCAQGINEHSSYKKNNLDMLNDLIESNDFIDEDNDGKDDRTGMDKVMNAISGGVEIEVRSNGQTYINLGDSKFEYYQKNIEYVNQRLGNFVDENKDGYDDKTGFTILSYFVFASTMQNCGFKDDNHDGKDDNTGEYLSDFYFRNINSVNLNNNSYGFADKNYGIRYNNFDIWKTTNLVNDVKDLYKIFNELYNSDSKSNSTYNFRKELDDADFVNNKNNLLYNVLYNETLRYQSKGGYNYGSEIYFDEDSKKLFYKDDVNKIYELKQGKRENGEYYLYYVEEYDGSTHNVELYNITTGIVDSDIRYIVVNTKEGEEIIFYNNAKPGEEMQYMKVKADNENRQEKLDAILEYYRNASKEELIKGLEIIRNNFATIGNSVIDYIDDYQPSITNGDFKIAYEDFYKTLLNYMSKEDKIDYIKNKLKEFDLKTGEYKSFSFFQNSDTKFDTAYYEALWEGNDVDTMAENLKKKIESKLNSKIEEIALFNFLKDDFKEFIEKKDTISENEYLNYLINYVSAMDYSADALQNNYWVNQALGKVNSLTNDQIKQIVNHIYSYKDQTEEFKGYNVYLENFNLEDYKNAVRDFIDTFRSDDEETKSKLQTAKTKSEIKNIFDSITKKDGAINLTEAEEAYLRDKLVDLITNKIENDNIVNVYKNYINNINDAEAKEEYKSLLNDLAIDKIKEIVKDNNNLTEEQINNNIGYFINHLSEEDVAKLYNDEQIKLLLGYINDDKNIGKQGELTGTFTNDLINNDVLKSIYGLEDKNGNGLPDLFEEDLKNAYLRARLYGMLVTGDYSEYSGDNYENKLSNYEFVEYANAFFNKESDNKYKFNEKSFYIYRAGADALAENIKELSNQQYNKISSTSNGRYEKAQQYFDEALAMIQVNEKYNEQIATTKEPGEKPIENIEEETLKQTYEHFYKDFNNANWINQKQFEIQVDQLSMPVRKEVYEDYTFKEVFQTSARFGAQFKLNKKLAIAPYMNFGFNVGMLTVNRTEKFYYEPYTLTRQFEVQKYTRNEDGTLTPQDKEVNTIEIKMQPKEYVVENKIKDKKETKAGFTAGLGADLVIKDRYLVGLNYRFAINPFSTGEHTEKTHNVSLKFGIQLG